MSTLGKPLIDFDHQSVSFRESWPLLASEFHKHGPAIAWTEHHGGAWVLGDWQAATDVLGDWETFTSYNDLEGTGNGGRGVAIPQMPYRLDLSESDPPLHTERRRLEAPFFTPRAMREWRVVAQHHADEGVDAIIETGKGDLLEDIVVPTAARTTLHLLGYQLDWHDVAEIAHKSSYVPMDSPDYPYEQMGRMRQDFRAELAERRTEPRGDLISALATGLVNGKNLTDDEGESMMNALVFGGFDTTVSAAAHALIYLTRHPELIPRVVDDVEFRKNAVEEILRLNPPTAGVTRTAVRDTEILGQRISKGERVYMFFGAANRDPKKFDNPEEVQLERANANEHLSFSSGHHRCLGSPLAKVELSILLETVLRRMADLRIDSEEPYPIIGAINGFIRVPITFPPVARVLKTNEEG